MTNQGDGSGPSLAQARNTRHNHNHDLNHQHLHLHRHRRLHLPGADNASPHIRSPPNEKLHGRQVVIVQTVSVVHYIDATGAVTSVETLRSDPVAPTPLDPLAGVTAALSALGDALPSVSLPGIIPGLIDGAPSSTTSTSAESETSSSSTSLSASSETLTSTPFGSPSSAFPTLSGQPHDRTLLEFYTNVVLFSFHIRFYFNQEQQLSMDFHDRIQREDNANAGAGAQAPVPVPMDPTPEPPAGLTPETRNAVVGGVVGSVAGIALVVLALMYFLKWRRQRGQGIMLLGDGDSTARGRAFSSAGPASPSSGKGMTERSGPFAIPSALANLTGKRAIDAPPAEPATQEKGFHRVSGKKLISVLESGGDGYSDPHDSIGSDSSFYRDSQAFLSSSGQPPLQLGSPMRPVSGVPIFRDGPQRAAVQEQSPLPPGHRRSAFPTTLPMPDSVGRSFASRDGSRGSASRFTEDA
ncbi:hypothetical protein C8A00DRAFT_13050 [Chaetomidium leptoderma]|uniref:Uncharacterized protein n=1 Tax=Chaetomidium leptoderma TaxID=669021 RepID=A0AAN6VQX8_9PEZI|nr:hypothetical protein C8A00DRAFT_13050 [Chaetomidium leptoderma]